jgi:hypothetical protein
MEEEAGQQLTARADILSKLKGSINSRIKCWPLYQIALGKGESPLMAILLGTEPADLEESLKRRE